MDLWVPRSASLPRCSALLTCAVPTPVCPGGPWRGRVGPGGVGPVGRGGPGPTAGAHQSVPMHTAPSQWPPTTRGCCKGSKRLAAGSRARGGRVGRTRAAPGRAQRGHWTCIDCTVGSSNSSNLASTQHGHHLVCVLPIVRTSFGLRRRLTAATPLPAEISSTVGLTVPAVTAARQTSTSPPTTRRQ